MSGTERKTGLRKKLIGATVFVGILPVVLGLTLTYLKGTEELRKALGENFAGLAREAASKTDLLIDRKIEELTNAAAEVEVFKTVARANQAYRGLSESAVQQRLNRSRQDWEDAHRTRDLSDGILSNPASAYLAKALTLQEGHTSRVALYVTDRRGALVASINDRPPFLSSETMEWNKIFSNGHGQPYLGNLYRDAKTDRFLVTMGVPVLDPSTGGAVGTLILVSDIKELFKTRIEEVRFGKTGHAMLIDGNGRVLICPILPTGMHVTDPQLMQAITGTQQPNWTLVRNDAHGGTNSIVGTAPLDRSNQILTRSGSAPWFGFTRQDPKELYAPIHSLLIYVAAASVALVGLMVLLALAVSKRLVQPVHILHVGAELIGKGNLRHRLKIETNDEIEQLAEEFNQMAVHLEESYTSLEQRVADRTKELSVLNTIALTVNRSLDLQEILDSTLEKILDVMHVETGIIHTGDAAQGQSFLKAHRGLSNEQVRSAAKVEPGDPISRKAALLGKAIVIEEAQLRDYTDSPLVQGGCRSIVCIPVNNKNQTVATLTIASVTPRRFTPSDLQLLSSIGNQMGTAIDNATLYTRERMIVDRLKEIDRLKSEFLSNVSHELRLPLTSIIGFSELLLDRVSGDLTPDQDDYIRNIQESGHHLLEIINNLLNLSKLRAGKMELHSHPFDLASLIDSIKRTVAPLVAKKGVSLEARVDPEATSLYTDEGKVKQVLLNLLSNAIKFTPAGGEIRVRSRLTTLHDQPAVEIAVSDNGIGIRPEDKVKIFEEFQQLDSSFSRDYPGTGLGLTISKQFLELIRGRIDVESEYGRGSTFTIIFPMQAAPLPSPSIPRETPQAPAVEDSKPSALPIRDRTPGSTPAEMNPTVPATLPRILVVEDDPTVERLLTLYLNQEGYHVDHATDGEEAIEKAVLLKPFAITLDIMLQREDGWTILQKLKQLQETKDIPVIIISIIENRELGFSLGATDYFTKPIDRKAILESLKKLDLSSKIKRKPVNILVIDDDPKILQLMSAILESEGYGVLRAQQAIEGIDLAIEIQPDLILLDLLMPDISGFEALERLKLHPTAKNIPVIIFTARSLTEEDRTRLNAKIRGVIQKGKSLREALLTEIRKFEKLYPDKARMVDGLTGIYNERYLQNRLADESNRALRIQLTFSLLLVNLDRFQSFNEEHGVEAGNRVIQETAKLLRKNTRAANPLCRCGGSTFAIILTETTKPSAGLVGEKIRGIIERHAFASSETASAGPTPAQHFTISIGLATFFEDGETPEQLMVHANQALDEARSRGGNCVVKYTRPSAAAESPGGIR
ncbi:MAG: response regulator [Nitrospirae bacterium]|nr:response regulator [Nitrospirota bacterium]